MEYVYGELVYYEELIIMQSNKHEVKVNEVEK